MLYGRKSLRVSELRIGVVGRQGYSKVEGACLLARRPLEEVPKRIADELLKMRVERHTMSFCDAPEHAEVKPPRHQKDVLTSDPRPRQEGRRR